MVGRGRFHDRESDPGRSPREALDRDRIFALPNDELLLRGVLSARSVHRQEDQSDVTPFWRTLKAGGELNPKYPGGVPALKKLLAAEGHTIVARGKRFFVAEFEKRRTKTDAVPVD